MPDRVRGTLVSLYRWPVKSCGGERLRAGRIGRMGLGGDRTYALVAHHHRGERHVTARDARRLLQWQAGYPDAPDDALDPDRPPLPVLVAPDGRRRRWDDPELPAALEADLGRPVRLEQRLEGQQDLPSTLLVTTEASRRAVEQALGRGLDLRRFRTNLHVDLDAPAFAEERWEGRRLRVGAAEIELLHPCRRCVIPTRDPDTTERWPDLLRWLTHEREQLFGINARVLDGARIAVGDRVELEPALLPQA